MPALFHRLFMIGGIHLAVAWHRSIMRALPVLLLQFGLILPNGGGQGSPPPPFATHVFGISLATSANNELFTCFVVKEFDRQVVGVEPIKREDFILQAKGLVPSVANPEGVDLFRKHRIRNCMARQAEAGQAMSYRCDPLDELWKLRFQEYPFLRPSGQGTGLGWAETRNAPSPRQMLLLSDYGILYLTGLCRGDDVFRLLHDVADSAWVANYRKGL